MANGIRTGDPPGFSKGPSSKFREGSKVRQTPEEGWRTYRPKRCVNDNKDEDNSPKTLNDENTSLIYALTNLNFLARKDCVTFYFFNKLFTQFKDMKFINFEIGVLFNYLYLCPLK